MEKHMATNLVEDGPDHCIERRALIRRWPVLKAGSKSTLQKDGEESVSVHGAPPQGTGKELIQ